MSVWSELKSRKVVQVATVYAVVAWLLIQIVTSIEEPLNLPSWADTLVIVLLAAGFPIALVLSWAFDLTSEGIAKASKSATEAATPQAAGNRFIQITQVVVLLAVGFLILNQYMFEGAVRSAASVNTRPSQVRSVSRFTHVDERIAATGRANSDLMALSPDGARFAYITDEGLFVREMDELEAHLVPGTEDAWYQPFFSPDGRSIGYFSERGEFIRDTIGGGAASTIAAEGFRPWGASWLADGSYLFVTADDISSPREIVRISSVDGSQERLVTGEDGEQIYNPVLLPGGQTLIFTSWIRGTDRDSVSVVAQSLATGQRTTLVENGSDARYVATGYLVFARGNNLLAVRFDPDTLTVFGSPVPVVEGVRRTSVTFSANYGISENGTLAYLANSDAVNRRLVWIDRQGHEELISGAEGRYTSAQLSPNDEQLVLTSVNSQALQDVWTFDLDRASQQILLADRSNASPIWSPDGDIAINLVPLDSAQGGNEIYRMAADGAGSARALTRDSMVAVKPADFSPAGSELLFEDGPQPRDIWIVPVDKEASAGHPLLATEANEYNSAFSPDGKWIAYQSNVSGQYEIYVRPYPDVNARRIKVSVGGGVQPHWAHDRESLELFYLDLDGRESGTGALMAVAIQTDAGFVPGAPRLLFENDFIAPSVFNESYDVSSDDRRFLMIQNVEAERSEIVVVQNWLEELERLLPAE